MSNSSRIEAATRSHVGAVLTSAQIMELVKVSDPSNTKGVYPSDCAYKRDETGKLIPRGKTAYGDGVLEYVGENNFKVLATADIVRRPSSKKTAVAAASVAPAAQPEAKTAPGKAETGKKKSSKASKPPVAPKSKANLAHAAQ